MGHGEKTMNKTKDADRAPVHAVVMPHLYRPFTTRDGSQACAECYGRQGDPIHAACDRCDGDGKAHGSDRPFEWSGPGTYPGPCPKCKGSGVSA